ncbi:hypothetical protein AAFF_G00240670 [Aldrovandia affinis]|uniref:Uncharacterized protein n=1 Tax=Aldrovandia affinis TaxID=143900 RepID=A0AAD7WTN0_9TELE|nr:hypothetical protein AAFF_G00240670 [Aldrovandia affinis]
MSSCQEHAADKQWDPPSATGDPPDKRIPPSLDTQFDDMKIQTAALSQQVAAHGDNGEDHVLLFTQDNLGPGDNVSMACY